MVTALLFVIIGSGKCGGPKFVIIRTAMFVALGLSSAVAPIYAELRY